MKNSSTCTSVEVHCSACAWPVLAIAIDHSMTLLNASPHPYENISLEMEFTILDPPRHPHRYICSWSNLMYVLVIGTALALYLHLRDSFLPVLSLDGCVAQGWKYPEVWVYYRDSCFFWMFVFLINERQLHNDHKIKWNTDTNGWSYLQM